MHVVLAELHRDKPPPKSLPLLSERVQDLVETGQRLEEAKKMASTDRIFGLLASAVLAGLVAASVLGFIANPVIGLGALVLTLAFLLYCHTQATSLGQKDHRETQNLLSMYPLGVLLGPFILSYLLMTRIPALEAKNNACRQEIQTGAVEAARYWAENGRILARKVEREEERVAATLLEMKKMPIRSIQGERDLAEYRQLLERTRLEIGNGQAMAAR